jgi:cellulose synthase/poly-beta-1,6-N-acetylglucosamine synthase-like glycosyltransferase
MGLPLICFNIFRFGFALVFVGLHCALMAGLFFEWRRDRESCRLARSRWGGTGGESGPRGGYPAVSVIVPINNEALRMEGLLRSLAVQDYPEAEYIFIDDRSTDRGPQMLRAFAETRERVTIINLTENAGSNHKQYALGRGIEAASGEFLLFTDADCEVPPGWIQAMIFRMADDRTGVTIGPVFKRSGGRGFFHLYQCFDHAVRYTYLAASTGLGAAGGGFGNNLILRREALDSIGGYGAVPVSPTEDAALISRIRSHSAYRIRSACGVDVHVITKGEHSWRAFINQTLRWNNGGLFSPDPVTRFNFGFLMVTISMGIIALPLLPFIPSLWPLSAAVLFSMTMDAIATLGLFRASLPKAGAAYIGQTVFTPMYFTLLTILGFCGVKAQWKEGPEGGGGRS